MISREHFQFSDQHRTFPILGTVSMQHAEDNWYREQHLHRVKLEIASEFRCPNETYELSKEEAMKSIKRLIFKEVLEHLTDIKQTAYSGDHKTIIRACNRLEKRILE